MQDEEARAWLALSLAARGNPGPWMTLARAAGGALAAATAPDAALAALGARPEAIARLRDGNRRSAAVLERCRGLALQLAWPGSGDYPAGLERIPDPPLVLFWRGTPPSALEPALAVVGARRCTAYGERVARRIGEEAAGSGITVVSGLARGVDAAAHRGAMESGRTAAVLAGGLDRIYPAEHASLARRIVEGGGALVSEQPPDLRPVPRLFPFRNRIITALAAATVVVEAGRRSGSLASARHALEQGREVFAVPGPIDSELSEGSNRLLGGEAWPYRSLADLEGVPGFPALLSRAVGKHLERLEKAAAGLGPDAAAVLAAIAGGLEGADGVAEETGLDGTRVLALLTALELDGLLEREAGGGFRATIRKPPGRAGLPP